MGWRLNGEKIHANAAIKPEPTPLTLKLKAGKNTLLVKMCDAGGAHSRGRGSSPLLNLATVCASSGCTLETGATLSRSMLRSSCGQVRPPRTTRRKP